MLAYLFSHRPEPDSDVRAYEGHLRLFHAALAAARLDGFLGSNTFRVGERYCDWYLLASSAVLDALNDAAVSGERSPHHDAVAHVSTDGAGKLLKLAAGAYDAGPGFEARFSKPRGMSYPELYRRMEPWTGRPGFSLWRRMMVLGPAPEFCLVGPSAPALPSAMALKVVRRAPLAGG